MRAGDTSATETVQRGGSDHALVRRFRLSVIEGADAGASYASDGDHAVVGSHEGVDFLLHDRAVSRFHFEIALENGQPVIRDRGSRNGTLVDGVRIFHAEIRDGSVVTIGRTKLRFDLDPDHVKIPLSERHLFGTMVGQSQSIRRVFAMLERASASEATVLLEGETGTGKEVAAESIHQESARKEGPFLVVDCGAIPPDLLESELFGHEKGAFTGAVAARKGAFEEAEGGSIFLDEVGELSLDLQPKLLRALEAREIKRVGTNKYVPINVRVIAATNRDLLAEVNERKFRSDVYYRLAVVRLRLPSLRERPEDLPVLVETILEDLGAGEKPEANALRTQRFRETLSRHSWPGNVRELRNYVERCLALNEQIPLESAPGSAPTDAPVVNTKLPLRRAREIWTSSFERRYLEQLLQEHGDNVSAAARAAGVARIHFYRLLWRYGLR